MCLACNADAEAATKRRVADTDDEEDAQSARGLSPGKRVEPDAPAQMLAMMEVFMQESRQERTQNASKHTAERALDAKAARQHVSELVHDIAKIGAQERLEQSTTEAAQRAKYEAVVSKEREQRDSRDNEAREKRDSAAAQERMQERAREATAQDTRDTREREERVRRDQLQVDERAVHAASVSARDVAVAAERTKQAEQAHEITMEILKALQKRGV